MLGMKRTKIRTSEELHYDPLIHEGLKKNIGPNYDPYLVMLILTSQSQINSQLWTNEKVAEGVAILRLPHGPQLLGEVDLSC